MKRVVILSFSVMSFFNLSAQIAFTDVTATAGIAFNTENVESLAWGDYDNDGDEDLFLSTDGLNKLMRNDGNDVFTEVGMASGLTDNYHTTGCVFADFDNDGDLDIFVTSVSGTDPELLYENLGAPNYTFQSIPGSTSGITDTAAKKRGLAVFDFNRDGLLDIYVGGTGNDFVYKNLGNLQFEEVSSTIGVNAPDIEVGVVTTDINNDGWIDIFTGNRSFELNKLFLNDGTGNYNNITVSAGIDEVGFGMGVLSFDYDNDLDMDLYWTTWPNTTAPFQSNALYQNQGNNTFLNKTSDTNTLDTTGWGISCNAGDIDNDRFEDFFVSNGFSATSTQSVLYKNMNGTGFQDITTSILGNLTYDARGVAFADYDNDGDLDICLTGGPNADTRLWRNDSNNSNNWVILKLEGVQSNKSAIGARINLTAGGVTTVKEVSGGAGRGSFNSLPVEFGLGNATTVEIIKIRWPNGTTETFNNINSNQINIIKEGSSTLSVDENLLDDSVVNIYPNPFKNTITIDVSQLDNISTIKVYTILGELLFKSVSQLNKKTTINIESSYKGLLFVVVESNSKTFVRKLIKY
ncbi:MAG TPA: T9SS type A sorting domain-containing protein [Flavobacteriia bacterium]|nr:T9SS type A sorting domain-containing protein [Flavobacteriia bacterium]